MAHFKKLIPPKLKEIIWKVACEQLHLKSKLTSGIPVKVNSFSDWCIYNDIFVDCEYDEGIITALAKCDDNQFAIVDLGANVGFFTLRVLHLLSKMKRAPDKVYCLLVEGSPRLANELKSRFAWSNSDKFNIDFVIGLVGQKSGSAFLDIQNSQIMNRVASAASSNSIQVPYVDIEALLAAVPKIDLLKCDIEGSEKQFIESYPALLGRTQTAIFEFHEPECPASFGVPAVTRLGFSGAKLLKDQGVAQTWSFTREDGPTALNNEGTHS